ncbi:hypothetical protein SELMODRAFT_413348 [Selaginella moellendorffii]|uniref:Coiled-coil domain-containing protein 12 n=1 Tax=Selaginella moellendorffii TaxID=88036 RepID=D8RP65_SELML|nr:hypothetical protein SELMODRAFT_413348 [Selaginella moellendorffii]
MAESVEQRRERLRALREAVELGGAGDEDAPGVEAADGDGEQEVDANGKENLQEEKADLPPIRFRNYLPRDEELQKLKREPPVLPKFEDPVAVPTDTSNAEDPMLSIAPKKANWDLRRDATKKLEKLEKRTTRAIIELMGKSF